MEEKSLLLKNDFLEFDFLLKMPLFEFPDELISEWKLSILLRHLIGVLDS